MKQWLVLGVLLTGALAGCLGDDDDEPGKGGNGGGLGPAMRYELPDDPMPEGAGHDHTAVDQHKFLWNYDFSSRDPLMQNDVNIAGVHAIDSAAGYLFGAVYGSHLVSVDGGLVIWDLADPASPVEVGRWTIPGAVGGDRSMEVTQDGEFAVLSLETVDCLGHINPTVVTAYLIDTRDKTLPIVADVLTLPGPSLGSPTRIAPSPFGEHSVSVHHIAGDDYAFIFGKIFLIDRESEGTATLVDTGVSVNTGHDLYVRDTPWNTTWVLTANGDGGLQIYDVTDPLAPVELAAWDLPERQDLAAAGINYYFHTADVAFYDDQTVVIVSSEDWEDHPSPLWILDASSIEDGTPGELELIGSWQNPGDHTALGTSFSLHNPRWGEDGILTISSYHGGLWQLDLRHPDLRADPAEIAYAVYAEGSPTQFQDPVFETVESQLCGLGLTLDAPTYMDVVLGEDGILYTADVYMGLYTFTPTADHPVYGTA